MAEAQRYRKSQALTTKPHSSETLDAHGKAIYSSIIRHHRISLASSIRPLQLSIASSADGGSRKRKTLYFARGR